MRNTKTSNVKSLFLEVFGCLAVQARQTENTINISLSVKYNESDIEKVTKPAILTKNGHSKQVIAVLTAEKRSELLANFEELASLYLKGTKSGKVIPLSMFRLNDEVGTLTASPDVESWKNFDFKPNFSYYGNLNNETFIVTDETEIMD